MKWVRIEDESLASFDRHYPTPSQEKMVLVWCKGGRVGLGQFLPTGSDGSGDWYVKDPYVVTSEITHWLEIVPPRD